MKKKRATSSLARPPFKFGSKFVILVCAVLFLLAFLRLHFQTTLQSVISFYQASRVFGDDHFKCTPKIAFLFLARRNLPLDFLWGTFLKNVDTSMFSIYVHSEPGFVFNESNTRSAFFYGRQLNNSIQLHTFVQFWLCLQLLNVFFKKLCGQSVLCSFIDVKENRYSPEMSPVIPKEKWRKGSQWIALIRRHAVIVVDDDFVFPVFRKFCKRWPPADLIKRRQILQAFVFQNGHNCIPDEHYVQTLLKMSGLENELERRTLTYSLWNQSAEAGERRSWHPFRFNHADASPQLIQEIKVINHVYYDSENRKELCHVNITIAPCFLFARKFTPLAAVRLLTERSVDLQDAASVFHAAP